MICALVCYSGQYEIWTKELSTQESFFLLFGDPYAVLPYEFEVTAWNRKYEKVDAFLKFSSKIKSGNPTPYAPPQDRQRQKKYSCSACTIATQFHMFVENMKVLLLLI